MNFSQQRHNLNNSSESFLHQKCYHGNNILINYRVILKGDVFYVTLHLLNIKTQTMCQIKGYLISCYMAVLTYILYNYHMPYLHKCIHYSFKRNKLSHFS